MVVPLIMIACNHPPGAGLLLYVKEPEAAVLRYQDHSGSGYRELVRLRPDGSPAWQLAVGPGPTEIGSLESTASPWIVQVENGLWAVDEESGNIQWKLSLDQPVTLLRAKQLLLQNGQQWELRERHTGKPLSAGSGAPNTVIETTAWTALVENQQVTLIDPRGQILNHFPTYPLATCIGEGALYWTDPNQQSWKMGLTGPEPLLETGRIRNGCAHWNQRWVLPVHRGEEAWMVSPTMEINLGAGSFLPFYPVSGRFLPIVLERDGGRQIQILDLEEGRVIQRSHLLKDFPVDRLQLGQAIGLITPQYWLDVQAEDGALRTAWAPPSSPAREQRIETKGTWSFDGFQPWKSTEPDILQTFFGIE